MNIGNEKMMAIVNALRKWPKWALILVTIGIVFCLGIAMFLLLPQTSQSQDDSSYLSSTGLAFGVFLKLGVVVVLIIGLAIILKKWQTNTRITKSKQISIVETLHLSPHRSLYLIKFGDQNILIGATDQAITNIAQTIVQTQKTQVSVDDNPLIFSDYLSRANSSSEFSREGK